MTIAIRDERPGDEAAIHDVVQAAFEGPDEARLVDRLRENVAEVGPWISLVASEDDRIVGHVLFTEVTLHRGEETLGPALGLAPVSVHPDRQRRGIGDALVRSGLEHCRALSAQAVFVLGHAEYYPRFGFRPAADFDIRWEVADQPEHFFALELVPRTLESWRGSLVRYRPELTS